MLRHVFLLYLGLFVLALSRVHHYDWLNGWMSVSLIVNYDSHIIVGIFLLNYTKSRITLFIRCTFRLINKSFLYKKSAIKNLSIQKYKLMENKLAEQGEVLLNDSLTSLSTSQSSCFNSLITIYIATVTLAIQMQSCCYYKLH